MEPTMADILYGDFETRSTVDLRSRGLYNYAINPSTEVYCLGYAFNDEAPQIWWAGDPVPDRVAEHILAGRTFVAHNAPFELAIWHHVLSRDPDWPMLAAEQTICTAARCYAMALPGSLENAGAALGITDGKDKTGHTLMLRMCAPTNKKAVEDGKLPVWVTDKEEFTFLGEKVTPKWALKRLGEYCMKDVEVEREIMKRTRPLSTTERRVWTLDQEINTRGVLFDPDAISGGLAIRESTVLDLNKEMSTITGGAVQVCSALPALKDWLLANAIGVTSLNKESLKILLAGELPPPVRAALTVRQLAGRATSATKLASAQRLSGPDGRVRNIVQYHGAGTGRWSGRGLQTHNFPRDLPKPKVAAFIMQLIAAGDAEALGMFFDNGLTALSKMLRAYFKAAPGLKFVGGDWSNVEGRGIAWAAGEEWKVQAFRDADANPDGPDIYEQTYAESFGIAPEDVTSDNRQIGKVMELAFGYQGGVGAFHQMGAIYGVKVEDEVADSWKNAWRAKHPKIKDYWTALQRAAVSAVTNPGDVVPAGPRDRAVKFKVAGSFLWCLLPSGRTLCYPYPQLRTLEAAWSKTKRKKNPDIEPEYITSLTYKTVPSQDHWKKGLVVLDKTNSRSWARVSTYGGKLAENVTQAICRDILAGAILRLADAGDDIVLHIHDEIIAEGLYTEEDRARIQAVLEASPEWAKDFPLAAGCWINERYQK